MQMSLMKWLSVNGDSGVLARGASNHNQIFSASLPGLINNNLRKSRRHGNPHILSIAPALHHNAAYSWSPLNIN